MRLERKNVNEKNENTAPHSPVHWLFNVIFLPSLVRLTFALKRIGNKTIFTDAGEVVTHVNAVRAKMATCDVDVSTTYSYPLCLNWYKTKPYTA